MATFFLLQLWFLIAWFVDATESAIIVLSPELDKRLDRWESYLTYSLLLLFALITAVWIIQVGLALAGSTRKIPFVRRLTHKPWIIRFAFINNSIVLVLIPIIAVFAFHATSLTCRNKESAAVYFLYDEGIPMPRWVYAMGLYRISLQAQRNWGKESMVLDRLNIENLRMALAKGKVVILASHGKNGFAYAFNKLLPQLGTGTFCVGPPNTGAVDEMNRSHFLRTYILGADNNWSDVKNVEVSSELRLAYIFACNAGKKASQWEEHLAPAEVITYNRLSTVYDHAYWFAFTGPAKLTKLP